MFPGVYVMHFCLLFQCVQLHTVAQERRFARVLESGHSGVMGSPCAPVKRFPRATFCV